MDLWTFQKISLKDLDTFRLDPDHFPLRHGPAEAWA